MNTNTYGYFEQVYQLRSFTKAAKASMISPQGIAKAIRSLETELGVSLFDDSSGSQVPTPFGEIFHEFASSAMEAHERLRRDLRVAKSRLEVDEIRLCCSTGVLGVADEPIGYFEERYPNYRVILEDYPDYICDQRLRDGFCDLALTVYPFAADFLTVPIYEDVHCFWIKNTDPLSTKEALYACDLEGRTIVSVGPEFKGCRGLQGLLNESEVRIAQHKTSSEMILIERQVRNGVGIGLTVLHKAKLFEFDDEVKAVPFPDLPWRFGVSYLKTHELRPVERSFIHFMLTEVAPS